MWNRAITTILMYLNFGTQNESLFYLPLLRWLLWYNRLTFCVFCLFQERAKSKPNHLGWVSCHNKKETCMSHRKKSNSNPHWLLINVNITLFLEVLPTGEGDMLCLPKDCVPTREIVGSSTCLPQKLLPLWSLQHKTQVSLGLLHVS